MHRTKTAEELMVEQLLTETKTKAQDSLQVLHDTREIGRDILGSLSDQGDQLGVIQVDVDDVLYKQEIAKRQTRTISSIFWDLIYKLFPSVKREDHRVGKASKTYSSTTKISQSLQDDVIRPGLETDDQRRIYDETEVVLDEMGEVVGDLKVIANKIGDELEQHDKQLDVLSDTVTQAQHNSDDRVQRVDVLLQKPW